MAALLVVALGCAHGEAGDPGGGPSASGGSTATAGEGEPAAADPDGSASGAEVAQEIELQLKQPKEVDGMTLEWVEVQDSRCPKGVTCVWAGEAVVGIEYAAGEESGRIDLGLQAREMPASRNVAGRGLTLLSVEPYPEASRSAKKGEALIRLRVGPPVEGDRGEGAAVL